MTSQTPIFSCLVDLWESFPPTKDGVYVVRDIATKRTGVAVVSLSAGEDGRVWVFCGSDLGPFAFDGIDGIEVEWGGELSIEDADVTVEVPK